MNTLNVSDYNKNKENYIYMKYYNNNMLRMGLLAKGLFKYDGLLVKDMDTRFIENVLYMFGKMGFVKDKEKGFIGSPVIDSGVLNPYDIPLSYTFNSNTYNKTHLATNVEIMRANIDSIPLYSIVSMFAQRLADVDKTEDIRRYQLRKPYVVTCKESQRNSVEILFNKIDNFEKLVIADKDIETYGINILDLNVPYDLDKLDTHKDKIWNEFYTFLGINNVDNSKRERMVTDEVNANNECLNIIMQSAYECRVDACNRINEHFGTNISVRKVNPLENTKENGSDEE